MNQRSIAWHVDNHGPWVEFVALLLLLQGFAVRYRRTEWPFNGFALDWRVV